MYDRIIKLLEEKIKELQEFEWQAKKAKDYVACLHLYGAAIYFREFLQEIRKIKDEN